MRTDEVHGEQADARSPEVAEPVAIGERNWRDEDSGTLTKEKLARVEQMVQEVYLGDSRPWIIGYSGGKDSTTALQLIWHALVKLPKAQLTKPIHVICSDTFVENPLMAAHSRKTLDAMNVKAQAQGFPLTARNVYPKDDQTFWVNMIGRGYPAPYMQTYGTACAFD